jgi:hypothetical protein
MIGLVVGIYSSAVCGGRMKLLAEAILEPGRGILGAHRERASCQGPRSVRAM